MGKRRSAEGNLYSPTVLAPDRQMLFYQVCSSSAGPAKETRIAGPTSCKVAQPSCNPRLATVWSLQDRESNRNRPPETKVCVLIYGSGPVCTHHADFRPWVADDTVQRSLLSPCQLQMSRILSIHVFRLSDLILCDRKVDCSWL